MASSRRPSRSWLPRTRWGWVLCVLGLLFVLWHLPLLWRRPAFSGAGFFSFALVVAGGAWLVRMGTRTVQRFMWAVRNRLLVTYFFLAAIPVLLTLAMFAIAGYIFYGQYSIYLLARDFRARVEQVRDANAMVVAALRGNQNPEHIERWAISTYDHYVFHHGGVHSYFYNARGHSPDPHAPALPGWLLRHHGPALFSGIIMRRRKGEYEVAAYRPLRLGLPGASTGSAPPVEKPAAPNTSRLPGILTLSRLNHRYMTTHTGNLGVVRAFLSSQRGQITTSVNPDAAPPSSGIRKGPESTTSNPGSSRTESYPQFPGSLRPLPPAKNIFDQRIFFPATLSVAHWSNGHRTVLFLSVITRPSILNRHLFGGIDLGRRGSGTLPLTVLSAIGIFFILLELMSLLFGLRLTRTITTAIHDLYVGTQHVHRGDFEYRIPVRMRDQLADLEGSFNTMTTSIRRLLREEQQKQRLESEIQIAQEVQAQLFPASAPLLPGLELAGRCLPARMVSGDFYDFLPLQGESDLIAAHPGGQAEPEELISQLALVVGDVSGKGISAALLMATISSALRAYQGGALRDHESRRLEIPGLARWTAAAKKHDPAAASLASAHTAALEPARILARLNNQLYHGTPAEKYATMFYALYDAPGRRLTYVNAGHPPPAILGPQGTRRLDEGGTVVGLFPELSYRQASVTLAPGDLLVVWSDGLSEPENEYGVEFGEDRLLELIARHQGRPLAEIIAHVMDHLREWCGEQEQPDDATLVLARAT